MPSAKNVRPARRLRFRIATLLWLVLVLAAALGGWHWRNVFDPPNVSDRAAQPLPAPGTPRPSNDIRVHSILSVVLPGLDAATGRPNRVDVSVVAINSDGTLVLEGNQTMRNNERVVRRTISGRVAAACVRRDNCVLAREVADLRLETASLE